MNATETYAYAIGSHFTISVSVPGNLDSIQYRAHKYFSDSRPQTLQGEVKLFKKRQQLSVRKIELPATQDQFAWHTLNFPPDTEVDTVEFPAHFDFDNVHLVFQTKRVWEVAKLDYLRK